MPKITTERIIDRPNRQLSKAEILSIVEGWVNDGGLADQFNNAGGGGTSVPIDVTVSPSSAVSASGYVGGTFSGSQVYTVTNNGTGSVTVAISKNASWLTLSTTSMTLAASASDTVTVSIDATAAAALLKSEYVDLIIFNASNDTGTVTAATRMVSLSVQEPKLEDIIKSMEVLTGSGATMTITIPADAAVGDEYYGFAQWEGSITGVDPADRFDADTHIDGVTRLYLIDVNSDNNWDNPPPRGGTNILNISHEVTSGEAGTSITWDLVYVDPDTSATTPYSGTWTIVMFLLDGAHRLTIDDPGYDLTSFELSYYDEPPSGAVYNRAGMDSDIELQYRLCFFASATVGASTFSPSILMTEMYEQSNFKVWGRVMRGPYSFADLYFNPSATYFIGAVYPVSEF